MLDETNTTMGAFEAKTHFSQVLNRVEQGQIISITRHGRTIAKLIPAKDREESQAESAMQRILERRKRLGRTSVSDLIKTSHEGHREP